MAGEDAKVFERKGVEGCWPRALQDVVHGAAAFGYRIFPDRCPCLAQESDCRVEYLRPMYYTALSQRLREELDGVDS